MNELERIVKKTQEKLNVSQDKELGFDLDYLKQSGAYVNGVKFALVDFVHETDMEYTTDLENTLLKMYFEKVY